ncbi:hypothetical protein [Rhodobacter sp. 24-YEA-8]|uniref:hypothetical protein n=1 Tax=Rhodobacter sp. 24-YEA-8 TaxID=1884310 RepID=UPI000B85D85D|nr:hypothetical protein [Rhodobacter sp. 24-YEA-8]
MIDRPARDAAAQTLRSFISGKITNVAFEDLQPQTDDPAIHAIWDTCWIFYDDFKTHRLEGKNRLNLEQRKSCVRWIVFLHSDLEYSWPPIRQPGSDPNLRVSRGLWRSVFFGPFDLLPEEVSEFMSAGYYAVWPFNSVKDYKQAIRSPRMLAGIRAP